MRPRSTSRASVSSINHQLIDSDYPSSPPSRSASSHFTPRGTAFDSSPTLESLYSDSTLDFDVERLGRYSVPPLPRPSSSGCSSSASSIFDSNTGNGPTSSSRGLIPATAGLYSFEKGKWPEEDDDAIHNPGKLAPRVGRARLITELDAFRYGHGRGWAWAGFFNVAAVALLIVGIVGVFGGQSATFELWIRRGSILIFSHMQLIRWLLTSLHTAMSIRPRIVSSGSPCPFALPAQPSAKLTWYCACFTVGPTPNTTSSTNSTTGQAGQGALINANAPNISNRAVIDPDTPTSAYTKTGIDNAKLKLVFSDEFNVEGRTFYTGEDPLHYWQTDDLEWYDPGNAITEDGVLALTLEKATDAESHGLGYLGGMLQSWNKFCFTGGRIEVAVSLPGTATVSGYWPSVQWFMGNLGRAGYGASLDGTWPYSYAATSELSQTKQTRSREVQLLPTPLVSHRIIMVRPLIPEFTAIFGVDYTPTYLGGEGTGVIYWINQGEVMWKISDTALAANAEAEVGARPIPGEPMSIIANLGLSTSFTSISEDLVFPAKMRIDYIRVYQPEDNINIGCSPPLYPTAEYIANNLPAYSNPNLTTYAQFRESVNDTVTSFPKNRLIDTC
ncbi:beta-glucan synthesis-associated protein KRE6, partial [Phenoliferia sp. Uapishka_3]